METWHISRFALELGLGGLALVAMFGWMVWLSRKSTSCTHDSHVTDWLGADVCMHCGAPKDAEVASGFEVTEVYLPGRAAAPAFRSLDTEPAAWANYRNLDYTM
jgi:hypothetical protein